MIEMEGEEADDVIATLARHAGERDRASRSSRATSIFCRSSMRRRPSWRRGAASPNSAATTRPPCTRASTCSPHSSPITADSKATRPTTFPGFRASVRRRRSNCSKARDSLDALLADPTLAGTPKLEALIREHGETARFCRDVSILSRDLPLDVPMGGCRYTRRRARTRCIRSTAISSSNRCSPLPVAQNDAATLFPLDDAERLEGTYRSFAAAVDPPDFALLSRSLRDAAAADTRRLRCAAKRSASAAPRGRFFFSTRRARMSGRTRRSFALRAARRDARRKYAAKALPRKPRAAGGRCADDR